MARPRKTVDERLVIELAENGRTLNDIAAYCGVSDDTISRRFADAVERGKSLLAGKLRSKQVQLALAGNTQLLIWAGKQFCNQSDKAELTGNIKHEHIDLSHLSGKELESVRQLIDSAQASGSHLGREL